MYVLNEPCAFLNTPFRIEACQTAPLDSPVAVSVHAEALGLAEVDAAGELANDHDVGALHHLAVGGCRLSQFETNGFESGVLSTGVEMKPSALLSTRGQADVLFNLHLLRLASRLSEEASMS